MWADLFRLNKQISISALYLVYFEAAIGKIVLSVNLKKDFIIVVADKLKILINLWVSKSVFWRGWGGEGERLLLRRIDQFVTRGEIKNRKLGVSMQYGLEMSPLLFSSKKDK